LAIRRVSQDKRRCRGQASENINIYRFNDTIISPASQSC
jgi:hypothetical protein